jgi:hypothetical protein
MNAHKDGLIEKPIISLASQAVKCLIGELDVENCENWIHYDQQNAWTLTAKSIEILGYSYKDAVVVSQKW